MSLLRRIKIFISLDFKTVLVFLEAWLYLGWARFLLIFLPFNKVASQLGDYMKETSKDKNIMHMETLKKVYQAIDIMCRYTFWESKCFVKAIAGMKMLDRRNIETTLYLGTANDEKSGNLIAHAWLRSGPFYITGREGMHRFTEVATFANNISEDKRRKQ